MSTATQLSAIAVSILAALHLLAPRLRCAALEQPTWLSVAGGMSVAYATACSTLPTPSTPSASCAGGRSRKCRRRPRGPRMEAAAQ